MLWPPRKAVGYIRELDNLIERSVILSPGPELCVPLSELKAQVPAAPNGVATLAAAEREHILRALGETHGVVGGPSAPRPASA